MIFYRCTGEDNCQYKKNCYLTGGTCKHTDKREFSKNFKYKDPMKHLNRFNLLGTNYYEK